MFDHETRIALARDRHLQLQRDMRAAAPAGRRRARRALGELMIALGDRLAKEPCPRRELSFRA